MTTHGTFSLSRIFLVRFIPVALICSLLALLFYLIEYQNHYTITTQQRLAAVRQAVRETERVTQDITRDVLYLAESAPFHNYLANGRTEDFEEVISDFKAFSKSKRVYDQIRYIDLSGQERIRVDLGTTGPVVVADSSLQNKSNRPYFTETIKLPQGQLYISPLDLNIEHNTIEFPHKPMLRVATPVYDRTGRLRGIIIVNYLAKDLLQRLTPSDDRTAKAHISLLNSEGFWLHSADSSREWGFMLNRPEQTLAIQATETWQRISSSTRGQFKDRYGYWIHESVTPLADIPTLPAEVIDNYRWHVVSHISPTELRQQHTDQLKPIGFMYVFVLLCAAAGVWMAATARYQQHLAEQSAAKQLARITLLMDSTIEGIYGTDLDGNCIIANQSCATLLGYQHPSQLLGRHMHSLMHHTHLDGSSYPCDDCKAHRVMHTGTVALVENEVFWRKDGTPLPVAYTARPIVQNGTTIGLVCSFIDISERKKAQDAQKRLLTILEESLNEIYLFDIDSLRFEYANQAALHNLGYSLAELQKITACEIKPQIDETAFRRMLQPLLTGTQEKLEFQTTHRRKDGSSYPVEVHLQLVQPDERPSFLAIIFDSSEKMLLEEQLRQSQKMEAIGQLSSGVAHDFNNILQIISGNAQVIQMQACPDCPAAGRQQEILKAVERGVNLTRSMLAFARRQDLALSAQELNLLLRETELLARKLLTTGHSLQLTLHETPLPVQADATLLQQCIFNLVTNARDAMPEGGVITISTQQVELTEQFVAQHGFGCIGPYALLQIKDNGQGINDEIRHKIFDPFFTTKGVGKGTGLGLAMLYGTVKQHHGYVTFDSSPGNGCTFNIYLPLDDNRLGLASQENQIERFAHHFGQGESILLVEDEELARTYLGHLLQRCNYRVYAAANGNEAIELARSIETLDLALLDLVMPGMDGIETWEELHSLRPTLECVFISAHGSDLLKLRNVNGHCVTKPINLPELLTLLRRVLSDARTR